MFLYICVHLAFREVTTGNGSVLLKVLRARGVDPPYTPLHTNGKDINGTKRKIEGLHSSFNAVLTWRMGGFYLAGSRFCTGLF